MTSLEADEQEQLFALRDWQLRVENVRVKKGERGKEYFRNFSILRKSHPFLATNRQLQ